MMRTYQDLLSCSPSKPILNILDRQNLPELLLLLEQQKQYKQQLVDKRHDLETSARKDAEDAAFIMENEVVQCIDKFNKLKRKINEASKEKLPQKLENQDVYLQLDRLYMLEKSSDYLNVFGYIRSSSEKIGQCLQSGMNSSALHLFSRLQLIVHVQLDGTQCLSLVSYCSNAVSHWEKKLTKILSKDFEKSLDEVGWPLRIVQSSPSKEQKDKFHTCSTLILRLSSFLASSNNSKENKKSTILSDFQDPILPIMLMVKPLRKRFRFNFFGTNTTSKETKPEWYFSQVKSWIRDLTPFLQEHLEQISLSVMGVSCTVEFIRTLSELLIIKADIQLAACLENDDNVIFAKILEESIIYENEIGQVLRQSISHKNYIPPFVSTLFSQPLILKHWLNVEKNSCQEKLDEIFSSESAWDRAVVPGPPEIVHLFLALLRFITDRFSHLQQPGQRIQFLQLLVDMIDDFRYRCLQIWKSRNDSVNDLTANILFDYIMADALWHVQITLETWEDLPLFESLSFFLDNMQEVEEKQIRLTGSGDSEVPKYKIGFQEVESMFDELDELEGKRKQAIIGSPNRGLFSNVKHLYECLGEEILNTWSDNVMSEIGNSLLDCYAVRWHSLPDQGLDNAEPEVSQEFLVPVQKLCSLCKAVENGMISVLAEKWLKRLAVNIDDMLMENLITTTKFSKGAIQQLKHDLTKGLFSIFSEYNIETSLFLTGITCALKIWDIPVGDAMLIFDDLTDGNEYNQEELLAEMDITLKPSEVLRLLQTRTDIIC